MNTSLLEQIWEAATQLRLRIEPVFSATTASPGSFDPDVPSSGHCAAVSVVGKNLWAEHPPVPDANVSYVSTLAMGPSHWFLRVETHDGVFDVDMTGDQFEGRPAVKVAPAGELYPETRVRSTEDLNAETLDRAFQLAVRSSLYELAKAGFGTRKPIPVRSV